MRFDRLLWKCLLPGRYAFSEEDIAVRLVPEVGETVLMFQTDTEAFREGQPGVKSCDLAFFYRGPALSTPALLFIELKGSDYVAAEAQLDTAFRRVWAQLDPLCQGAESLVCAVAVVGQSSPIDVKERIKQAQKERGLSFRYHFGARGKTVDLRPDLAYARKVKPTPVITPTVPLALPGGTQ